MTVKGMIELAIFLCLYCLCFNLSDSTDRASKNNWIGVEYENSLTVPKSTLITHDDEQTKELPVEQHYDIHHSLKIDWTTACLGFLAAIAVFVTFKCMCWVLQGFWRRRFQLPVRRTPCGRYPTTPRCEVFNLGHYSRQNLIPVQSLISHQSVTGNCNEDENESTSYSDTFKINDNYDKPPKSETPPPAYSPSMNQQRLH